MAGDPVADTSIEPRLPARSALADEAWFEHARADDAIPWASRSPEAIAPFHPPELVWARSAGWAQFAVRLAMAVWAIGLALVAWQAELDGRVPGREIDALTWLGVAIGLVWAAAGTWWAWVRAVNIQRLEGRQPSRARAMRAFWYAPAWIALMSVTLLRLAPNPDFDVRPPIIVAGFALAMVSPYRLVHRCFKSLVRIEPVAPVVVLGLLDATAIGIGWWRLSTWPDDASIDAGTLELTVGVGVAVAIVLVVSSAVAWYVDRAADVGERIRVLTLRTRHDHRVARVRGLDPMDPATRWALLEARRAAERAAGTSTDTVLDVSSWSAIRSTTRARRRPTVRHAPAPANTGARPASALAVRLGAELERGVGSDFASTLRSLARQYSPERGRRRGGAALELVAEEISTPMPGTEGPPRLMGWEALRHLIAIASLTAVAGCGWLFERATRFAGSGSPDALSPSEIDRIEVARAVIGWGVVVLPLATIAWAWRAHLEGRRFGVPDVRPPIVLAFAGIDAAVVGVTGAFDPSRTSPFSAAAVLLGVAMAMAALMHVRLVQAELETSQTATMGWLAMLPIGAMLAVVGPLRTAVVGDSKAELAFFAVTVGVAVAVTGALAAVATRDLEDAVRGSTRR